MNINKSQTELLSEISDKLDTVIGFMATRDINDPAAVVKRLATMGLDNKITATVAGLTEGAVAKRRTRMIKKKKTKKKTTSE